MHSEVRVQGVHGRTDKTKRKAGLVSSKRLEVLRPFFFFYINMTDTILLELIQTYHY